MYFRGAEHTKNEQKIIRLPRTYPVMVIKLFKKFTVQNLCLYKYMQNISVNNKKITEITEKINNIYRNNLQIFCVNYA